MNSKQNYSKFGQHLHYLTPEKLQVFWEAVDDSRDKLILKLIFELGCRVGEFTQIQLKHINFQDCSIFFPAENTKTNERRTGFIPKDLMNDLKDYLKRQGLVTKREENTKKPGAYLFPGRGGKYPITTRALQKMFRKYIQKAGLDEVYAQDSNGRQLYYQLTYWRFLRMPMLENLGKLTFKRLSRKVSAFRMTNAEEIGIAALNMGIQKIL